MARRKLGRRTDNRTALLRNLATDVIAYGRIETTEEKAKELRKLVDKLVTLGKRGNLHARRQAAAILFKRDLDEDTTVLQKLFGEVAEKYSETDSHLERQGGYTRIMKLGPRRGDGANMVVIELVEELEKEAN
ncbi:MAG TPA: 50S ribosomal protein L17 [Pseudogracilibacillus sp.]|nr:50S ribosomal protein L17 [Pseudogracilibacillus sp.]